MSQVHSMKKSAMSFLTSYREVSLHHREGVCPDKQGKNRL